MNDREFQKNTKRIQGLMKKWKAVLPLGWWHIEHSYYREPWKESSGYGSNALAETQADWQYMHAHIQWNVSDMGDVDDADLQKYVVHELTHCLLDSLTRFARGDGGCDAGIIEQSTTHVAMAIEWAYAAGKAEGSKR